MNLLIKIIYKSGFAIVGFYLFSLFVGMFSLDLDYLIWGTVQYYFFVILPYNVLIVFAFLVSRNRIKKEEKLRVKTKKMAMGISAISFLTFCFLIIR